MDKSSSTTGQALVEYLFVLLFVVMVSVKLVDSFSDFMRDSMGNLGHIMTMTLSTGVCQTQCFFAGPGNGFSP